MIEDRFQFALQDSKAVANRAKDLCRQVVPSSKPPKP